MVVLHLAFVLFVVFGGLLAVRWPRAAWLHVPAAIWGAAIELLGGTCPLTPLENALRRRAGLGAYEGDFIDRYLLPLLYPAALTRELQILLGLLVVAGNFWLYWRVLKMRAPGPGNRPQRMG